jgi:multidrug efflux pump subunit AcrA (membrane-fusion protein)
LLARIREPDGKIIELRSPLPGRIDKILKANGAQVSAGDEVISLSSDEDSVFEALRALTIIGNKEDLPLVQSFVSSSSKRISQQAGLTAKVLQSRN